jgi:hypothetical protein
MEEIPVHAKYGRNGYGIGPFEEKPFMTAARRAHPHASDIYALTSREVVHGGRLTKALLNWNRLRFELRSRRRRSRQPSRNRARDLAAPRPGLSVGVTPHLSTSFNVDEVDVPLVLELLARWLAEDGAELRCCPLALRSGQIPP